MYIYKRCVYMYIYVCIYIYISHLFLIQLYFGFFQALEDSRFLSRFGRNRYTERNISFRNKCLIFYVNKSLFVIKLWKTSCQNISNKRDFLLKFRCCCTDKIFKKIFVNYFSSIKF